MKALRAKLARLVSILRQHGIRSGVARIIAGRRSPLFGLSAPDVGLAHVTRIDRSSARLVVHGRAPSDAAQLTCTAVLPRQRKTFPVGIRRDGSAFAFEVPLRKVARSDGACDMKFVMSDGTNRWILGREPQPELFKGGAVTVPVTVVALPDGGFIRFRVREHTDGELRVVAQRMPGKVLS